MLSSAEKCLQKFSYAFHSGAFVSLVLILAISIRKAPILAHSR